LWVYKDLAVNDFVLCPAGAPLLYSKPHFYNGDKVLREGVIGLDPKQELHESTLDTHHVSSIQSCIKTDILEKICKFDVLHH